MINNSQKQRISITVDSRLLEEIDQMTKNRSAAVLKQKLSPNKAQTGFISYEYVTIIVEP